MDTTMRYSDIERAFAGKEHDISFDCVGGLRLHVEPARETHVCEKVTADGIRSLF